MRRIAAAALATMSTLVVGFSGVPAEPAAMVTIKVCGQGTGFCHLGQHWKLASLPIRVKLTTPPAGVSTTDLLAAATAAAAGWNAVWPVTGTNQITCAGAIPGTAICVDPLVGPAGSNPNQVQWAPLGCSGTPCAPVLGVTYRCMGTSATACLEMPPADPLPGYHIWKGRVVLTTSLATYGKSWRAAVVEEAQGEVRGNTDGLCGVPPGSNQPTQLCAPGWYDLQNVLTHEFGHLLGLDHPCLDQNQPGTCAAWDFPQTMWPVIYEGETSKRTLHYGDLLGAQVAAADSGASVGE